MEHVVHYHIHKCPQPVLIWARSIQSMPSHPTSCRSILILSSHLCLGLLSGLFPSGLPTKIMYTPLLSPMCYMPRPSHSSSFDHPNHTDWGVQIIKLLIMLFSPLPVTLFLLGPNIHLDTLFSNTLILRSSLNVRDQVHTHTKPQAKL